MRDVRVREGSFEGRCEACLEWWPLEEEFWHVVRSLRHCRACENLRHRVAEAVRRMDPDYRARGVARQRLYRREAAAALTIARREREAIARMDDPTRIDRARARNRDRMRAYRARKKGAAA